MARRGPNGPKENIIQQAHRISEPTTKPTGYATFALATLASGYGYIFGSRSKALDLLTEHQVNPYPHGEQVSLFLSIMKVRIPITITIFRYVLLLLSRCSKARWSTT